MMFNRVSFSAKDSSRIWLLLAIMLLLPTVAATGAASKLVQNGVKAGVQGLPRMAQQTNALIQRPPTNIVRYVVPQNAIVQWQKPGQYPNLNNYNQAMMGREYLLKLEQQKRLMILGSQNMPKDALNPGLFYIMRGPFGGPWGFHYENPSMKDLKELDGGDATKMFTPEFFDNPKVAEVLKGNIAFMKIKTGDGKALEETDFVKELLDVAKEDITPPEKTNKNYELLKKYKLEKTVQPPTHGKECLWSGHVANSNFARETDHMTPLETPPLVEVLSKTFGTENFPNGIAGKGFNDRWMPNVCPMFNAATIIYTSNAQPKDGVLNVYVNQLKEWSAFFDVEINLFNPADRDGTVSKINFVILSPPPSVQKYMDLSVDVVPKDAEATKAAVKKAFQDLPKDQVQKLYDNNFDLALKANDEESHPFDDASAGTRKKSAKCDEIYKGFFTNWAEGGGGGGDKPKTDTRVADVRPVALSFISDHFEVYVVSIALLLLILIAYHFLKSMMMRKHELKIVFNTESSNHYTEFAAI